MTRDIEAPAILRRADGSIDTGYYTDRGRACHGSALRKALRRLSGGGGDGRRLSGSPCSCPEQLQQKK